MKKLVVILLSVFSVYASVVSEVDKSRFTHNGEVLSDSFISLEWQDNANAKRVAKTWNASKSYCKKLTLDGKSDWRLPLKAELKYAYKIKYKFKNMASQNYWSSSKGVLVEPSAWNIYFGNGGEFSSKKSAENYVRCVRGNRYGTLALLNKTMDRTRQAKIDAKRFSLVVQKNDLVSYISFIKKYSYAKEVKEAIKNIHTILYIKAKEINTISSFNTFVFAYPNALEVEEANKLAYKMEVDKYLLKMEISSASKNNIARKILLDAKNIENIAKLYKGSYKSGYTIVVNRMHDLLKNKFTHSDATLSYMESKDYEKFTKEFETTMNKMNKNSYTKEIFKVSKKVFNNKKSDSAMVTYYKKELTLKKP